LIVADTHFGKDDIFRRAGIPLPRGPVIADLQRLTKLIVESGAERLVVLGDFLHAVTQAGDSFLRAFATWRRAHSALAIQVITGNHDRRETQSKWGDLIAWSGTESLDPPFVLAHEPRPHPDGYVLCGHMHPAMPLEGLGIGAGRVPVFWARPAYLILPSFGSFTGAANVHPERGDRVYAAAPERVIKLFG
jgi:uncharacterized protein